MSPGIFSGTGIFKFIKMSKIAIAGSVDFYNEEILIQKFDAILKNLTGLKEIVSGEDPGTEEMALRYAEENNIRLNSIPTLRDDIDCKPTSEIGVSEYGKIYWINAGTIPINKLLQA